MVKSIKVSDGEYWLLMKVKAEHKTQSPVSVLGLLSGMLAEEMIPELTTKERQIYELLKKKARTAGDLCLLLRVSRARISQIMRGKDDKDGLLKKRPDIKEFGWVYNTDKKTTTAILYQIEGTDGQETL